LNGGAPSALARRRSPRRAAHPRDALSTSHARGETVSEKPVNLGPECPGCGEPWLRPTTLPGRYRCVYCLRRYELVSVCPNCGEHSTIVRMSSTAIVVCNHCKGSMLTPV
jgi:ribosomal protein S27E